MPRKSLVLYNSYQCICIDFIKLHVYTVHVHYIYIEVIHILSVYIMRNLQKNRYLKDPSFRKYQCHCYIQSEKFISVKYKWFQPNWKMCALAIIFPNNRNAHSKEWLEGNPNAGIIWSLLQSNPATGWLSGFTTHAPVPVASSLLRSCFALRGPWRLVVTTTTTTMHQSYRLLELMRIDSFVEPINIFWKK